MPSWSNWDAVTPVDPLDTVDYAAPGVSIMSYYKSGLLAYLSGTSMAAPHVAGLLLMGEVTSNRMATPFYAGTADPIAILNNLPTVANQTLWGTVGNDTIIGGPGNDTIAGVPLTGSTSGQVDILTGSVGEDIFILADSRGAFYNDGVNRTLGTNDYALIQDFQSGVDKLQLLAGNYFTTRVGSNLNIYWDRNANGRFETSLSSSDELVAVLQNATITSGDVIFI
jgi:Ca2+-binding RTX toxin-like protein